MKLKPRGIQNGAEIDVKTHPKSMPKQVSKKLRKIMKIHVFLKRKIIQIHCKKIVVSKA